MRKFEMIDKGFEYATEGYRIKKHYTRKALNNTGFSTLNRYGYVAEWCVYPESEHKIYVFRKLADAKKFILNREG